MNKEEICKKIADISEMLMHSKIDTSMVMRIQDYLIDIRQYIDKHMDCDAVNHPVHYQSLISDKNSKYNIECIDAMVSAFGREDVQAFCKCNAFKYNWRASTKNGMEDIDKAIWYLNKYKELEDDQ